MQPKARYFLGAGSHPAWFSLWWRGEEGEGIIGTQPAKEKRQAQIRIAIQPSF